MVKVWQLRRNFMVLLVLLSACSFINYQTFFFFQYIKEDLNLTQLISQLTCTSSQLISLLIYSKIGPKWGLVLSFFISGVGSTLLMIFFDNVDIIPIFLMMGIFGIQSSFNLCFICNIQLIPTIYASTVFGFCNVVARAVTILSPLIAEIAMPIPLIVNISVCLIATCTSFLLIEKLPKFS